jgi:hypothetical protein
MLFVFLSVVSTLFLQRKKWILYFFSVCFLVYSLYFWPFVLLGHIIFILIQDRKSLKKFSLSLFLGVMFFLPWISSFLTQLQTGLHGMFTGWTGVVSFTPLKAVALMYAKFILGKGSIENNLIYADVIAPTFLLFLLSTLEQVRYKKYDLSFVIFWSGLLSSFVVSIFVPILAPQRLLFLLPFFYLEIAKYTAGLKQKKMVFAMIILVATQMVGIVQYWLDPSVQREQWRDAVSYVENESTLSPRAAIFVFPDPFAPTNH